MTRPDPAVTESGQVGTGSADTEVTAAHRQFLRDHGITDEVIDRYVISDHQQGEGWALRWDDGSDSPFWRLVFDRDKRPNGRDGKPMKARWPSKAKGGDKIGLNRLRIVGNPAGTIVAEGDKQSLSVLSWAPPDWSVLTLPGIANLTERNADRLPDLTGQDVVLIPDADSHSNDTVKAGVASTARLLKKAGAASVRVGTLGGIPLLKEGADDVLARTLPEKRAELLARVIESAQPVGGDEADDGELFVSGTEFLAAAMVPTPALWGTRDGDVTLWAKGESLMLVGPPGVGKSTMAHLVVFGRLGLLPDAVGWPVTPDDGKVLYLAMDRPQQIARAMYRLVRPEHRQALEERLAVRQGPVPGVDMVEDREWLLNHAREVGATTIVVDSVKDVLPNPSDEERAGKYNQARQLCLAAGIEVIELHHNRKANGANKEPMNRPGLLGGS